MKLTLLDRMQMLPPYAVRLLAHDRRRWQHMTSEQIARKSGLSICEVKTISVAESWLNVKLEKAIRFTAACGIDMAHLQRHLELIRRTNGLRKARHLRKAFAPQGNPHHKFYARLVAKMPTFG